MYNYLQHRMQHLSRISSCKMILYYKGNMQDLKIFLDAHYKSKITNVVTTLVSACMVKEI